MKKITALLLALLCAASVLCGCNAKTEEWNGYENADITKYVKLGQYDGLKYAKASAEVSDEEVQNEIDAALADLSYRSDITDRAAQKGDYCVLTYVTEVDGAKIDALCGEEVAFSVGSVYTLPELVGASDSVIGKTSNESYEIDARVDGAEDEALNGKTAKVKITVNAIFEYVTPGLEEEGILPQLSETAKTADEYRAQVRAELEADAKAEADYTDQDTLWNLIVEGSEMLKYPESEVERYAGEMHDYYVEYASYYGYTLEEFLTSAYGTTTEEFDKSCREYGETSVKNDAVLYAMVNALGITVTDAEYAEALLRYFNESGSDIGASSVEEFEEYYTKPVVTQTLLFEKVIEAVKKTAIPS